MSQTTFAEGTPMTTKTSRRRKDMTRKRTVEEQKRINQDLIDLLGSWREVDEEDAQEQRETMEYLRKALDENRPPGYKLFS
jgi:hypothetical protein